MAKLNQNRHSMAQSKQDELQLPLLAVPVADWLTDALSHWYSLAAQAGISLNLVLQPAILPSIRIDLALMNQSLGHLIDNALRHTPQGGQVDVRCTTYDGGIVVIVCDTGTGITAEKFPILFGQFFRTDQLRQQHDEGRGRGLTVVKKNVEAHGGQVWVKSEPGKGSKFFMRLPVAVPHKRRLTIMAEKRWALA